MNAICDALKETVIRDDCWQVLNTLVLTTGGSSLINELANLPAAELASVSNPKPQRESQ